MSETPRTDAATEYDNVAVKMYYVDVSFAEQLERELAAVTADLAALHDLASDRLLQIAVLREQRADMRVERDAAMADARRYRWLRAQCRFYEDGIAIAEWSGGEAGEYLPCGGICADESIDAAMAGKGEA